MKIITWNCCLPPWSFTRKQRLPGIIHEISCQNADIVCLQEVFFKGDARNIITGLRSAGFLDFFHSKDLLIASKYRLSKKQSFIFKDQGKFFSWAILDVVYGKGFQIVELSHGRKSLQLVNTHLLSANAVRVYAPRYQNVRAEQIEQILSVMDAARESIVAGDMNFEPDTSPYQKITARGFSDLFDKDIKTCKNTRPDHIFLKGLTGKNGGIIIGEKDISDHAALMVQTS